MMLSMICCSYCPCYLTNVSYVVHVYITLLTFSFPFPDHFNRLEGLLTNTGGNVIPYGTSSADATDLYFPPTFVVSPSLTAPVMTSEIFGPILPIVAIGSVDEAITFINARYDNSNMCMSIECY